MTIDSRLNISAVNLFIQTIDRYETTSDPKQTYINHDAARHLQVALNRLITSSTIDSYQMIRHLAKRMIQDTSGRYREELLYNLAAVSTSETFKDEIMAVAVTLAKVINGDTPPLDYMWLSRINNNLAIKDFVTNFKNTDLFELNKVQSSHILKPAVPIQTTNSNTVVELPIGRIEPDVTLSAATVQVVKFKLDDAMSNAIVLKSTNPTFIHSAVTLRSDINEFIIDRSVRFSNIAKTIADSSGCFLFTPTAGGIKPVVKLPSYHFKLILEIYSIDKGDLWTVSNVQIIPPSLANL